MPDNEPLEYSLPSDLISLAARKSSEISKSLEEIRGGFLTHRQVTALRFDAGIGPEEISASEVARFLGQLRTMAFDSAEPAPPGPKTVSLSGIVGTKLSQFIEHFFLEIRNVICKGPKRPSVPASAVVAELAHWLVTQMGVAGALGDGVAIAILLAVLTATKGAFCKMTEAEAKAALGAAKQGKRRSS
jgi:hypothetical protein